jgi:hypothetical protein
VGFGWRGVVFALTASFLAACALASTAAAKETPPIRDIPDVRWKLPSAYDPAREARLQRAAAALVGQDVRMIAASQMIQNGGEDNLLMSECLRKALGIVALDLLREAPARASLSFHQSFQRALAKCLLGVLPQQIVDRLVGDWSRAATEAARGHPSVQLFVHWLRYEAATGA